MCGIAGLIHKKASGANIGKEMTDMLQALKHRGPDSTGYALYGSPISNYIMRINLAEQADTKKGFDVASQLQTRNDQVDARMAELGAKIAK